MILYKYLRKRGNIELLELNDLLTIMVSFLIAVLGWFFSYLTTRYLNEVHFCFDFYSENNLGYLEIDPKGNSELRKSKFKILGYDKENCSMRKGEIKELTGVTIYSGKKIKICLGVMDWDVCNIKIKNKTGFLRNFLYINKTHIVPFNADYNSVKNNSDEKVMLGAILRIANYLTGDYQDTFENLTGTKELRTSLYEDLKRVRK